MLRRIAVLLVLVLASSGAAGCGGDDEDAATDSSAAAVTQAPADEAPSGECDVIQVLLKLDATEEQRLDVADTLDDIEGTEQELVEAESDAEPSMFLVTTETDRAADAVGTDLSGHPAVVSVVFPEQLC